MKRAAAGWQLPAIWLSFLLVHLLLGIVNLGPWINPFADVTVVYRGWLDQLHAGQVPGIDTPWVYPLGALAPMLLAEALSIPLGGRDAYGAGWLVLVVLLDAIVLWRLTGKPRRLPDRRIRTTAAWWFVAVTAALGPIGQGRIDAVTVPLTVLGLLALRHRRGVAGGLLALGAWIKVWPGAVLLAAITTRRGWLPLVAGAAAVTAGVVVIASAAGGVGQLLSFLGTQGERGLQVEAPAAVGPVLLAALGVEGYQVVFDREIITFQVHGPGTAPLAALTTPLMALGLLGVLLLALLARTYGAGVGRVLPPLALAAVLVLMLANKVGSPQFACWIVAPVLIGLLWDARRFRVPAVLALALAAATQLSFPWFYDQVTIPTMAGVALLVARAGLQLTLLAWSVRALLRARRDAARAYGRRTEYGRSSQARTSSRSPNGA